MISILYVTDRDKEFWLSMDGHTSEDGFNLKVFGKLGYVIFANEVPIGILHYSLLWDNMPFLNFINIRQEYRKLGYGKNAINCWENEMLQQGFKMVLLSTQVDEKAQFFYRNLGYKDCGCLVLNNCPLEQPMEMFLYKILQP